MWDTYLSHGPVSLIYFPFVIILGNLVALNLFLSIVVATFCDRCRRAHCCPRSHS